MTNDTRITTGSGNVFADLGLPETRRLAQQIKAFGLTQTAAGLQLGVSQPDVSRLMKGRPTGFSTDRLLAMLNALNLDVDIVVRPASPAPHVATVRIVDGRV